MSDPLPSARVPCPHLLRLPLLGVETAFATNVPAVLERIEGEWGGWASLRERDGLVSRTGPSLRIVVGGAEDAGGDEGGRPTDRSRPRPRVPSPGVMRVEGAGGSGVAEWTRLEGELRVEARVLEVPDELMEDWLEPLTLFLLGACDRQPVHAAAVVSPGDPHVPRKAHEVRSTSSERERGTPAGGPGDGDQQFPRKAHHPASGKGATPSRAGATALLLAGPSGAGKTTLAYAAWRTGRFDVLADEPVYVQLEPRLRVWGRRSRLHLATGARTHFPELRRMSATDLPTGKTKIVVEPGDPGAPDPPTSGEPAPDTSWPRYAERAGLCLLARTREGPPHLEPLAPEEAVAELTATPDPGYDLFADTIGERIARVATGGAWRLHPGGDPRAAVRLLDEAAAAVRMGVSR